MKYNKLYSTEKYHFEDTPFDKLMQKRITEVLLICSKYENFILEEDGRIEEQIFHEYVSLNLRYPPRFTQTSSPEQAKKLLAEKDFDLVITMINLGTTDVFNLANEIKDSHPKVPIVILTPFSREVSMRLKKKDLHSVDYVFSWLGNPQIFLAIIKQIEDKLNAEYDILDIGVPAIILVEDSVRYYSSYLPNIYKLLFKQADMLMEEGLNEHERMMKMRGRPKILHAKTYEEADELYEKYKENLLGVISDIRYPRNGKIDPIAGIILASKVLRDDLDIPILLQSSEERNKIKAEKLGVGYVNKYSKTLLKELKDFITENFGFGDFVFRLPKSKSLQFGMPSSMKSIDKASSLKELQKKLETVPAESLEYHITFNHFSKWLKARALYSISRVFKERSLREFDNDVESVRSYMIDTLRNYRYYQSRGKIAHFYKEKFDEYAIFSRIGDGLLGGKGRGLAFIDSFLKSNRIMHKFPNTIVTIPRTVVITTDVFEEFMEENNLYKIALSEASDDEILMKFITAKLPHRIHEDLKAFLSVVKNPVAIRSSSLLEDSHYQPFAGIYSTYMVSNNSEHEVVRSVQLALAIKSVYASVFFKNSKAYMTATSNVIDEEKMAVILQEITGQNRDGYYYPEISGVARSINFYPVGKEKAEEGVANLAFGLGKTIVDGGLNLRFCPKHPKKIMQLSTAEMTLKQTQKEFYALDMNENNFRPSVDEGVNLVKLTSDKIPEFPFINHILSTYDFQNGIIRDGTGYQGKKLITFAGIVKYGFYPLSEILNNLLETGEKEMNNPVEIEFAVKFSSKKDEPTIFNVLQIRPIVADDDTVSVDIDKVSEEESIIISKNALGNGIYEDIYDFVYVKPDKFDPSKTKEIAASLEKLNDKFLKEKKYYILVGPGRWGSSDPWLGIPVVWSQISNAKIIVEAGLKNYQIETSQGSHFFQNLTSLRVAYLTINPYIKDGYYDTLFLKNQEAVYEDTYIRHIKFDKSIVGKVDGKNSIGVIIKPS